MRVPALQCVQAREGPALENLPRTKARASWRYLWGKCADARCHGDLCVSFGAFHCAGHKRIPTLWPGYIGLVWRNRIGKPCPRSISASRPGRFCLVQPALLRFGNFDKRFVCHAACSRGGARDIGFCPQRKISMMRMSPPQQGHGSRFGNFDKRFVCHAACSRGGARDIGFCPRRKISMMRMSPPQQGHGSRSVSGVTSGSASCALACSGGWSQSNARHLARFILRTPLASRP